MSTIKSVLHLMFALVLSSQTAMADDPFPKGHYRLMDVDVYPINKTRRADGKINHGKSDTLTHSLRFDVKTIAEKVVGTEQERFKILNPTETMKMTVDKPIKFKGKVVPIGTNLLDYQEFNGRRFTIHMKPLSPRSFGSIRLTNDFVFPTDTYDINFEWITTDGDLISKKVSVLIDISEAGAIPKARMQTPALDKPARCHRFLVCGQKTYIMGADGKATWTYPGETRDGYVLKDGSMILTLSKSKKHNGGAVVKISADGKEKLIFEGTQMEVNSAHPTKEGTFVITEAGAKPRLLEITDGGEVRVEFPLACQTANVHLQTRMARKLDDGTYLVPHLLDFAVFNYDQTGKVINKFDTTVPGDTEHKIHTWPFTAIRHGKGQTLVTCTNGNRVMDFDADGKVVWTLYNEDLPGQWLKDPCGAQVLPNGNVVIAPYAAGRSDPKAPKLFEVNREKKVVWKYSDGQKVGVHHFQILDTNGKKIPGSVMK